MSRVVSLGRFSGALALSLSALSGSPLGGCSNPGGSPYDGDCPLFQLVETRPLQGATKVSPVGTVTFRFSDFPDPDTVLFPTVMLTSGVYRYTAHSSVDLVRRTVRLIPNMPLPTNVEITALATPDLRSLHGCRVHLPRSDDTLSVLLQFRTASELPEEVPPDATPPPLPDEDAVMELFARSCAQGCHAADDGDDGDDGDAPCLKAPAGYLSLCRAEAKAALVGIPAREQPGLLRISPRDGAHSYVLRKLLGASPARSPHLGEGALAEEDLLTLQRWIDAGVPAAPARD